MGLNRRLFIPQAAAGFTNTDNFDITLYTGNGANSDGGKVVTGVGFQPELTIVKNRTSSGENWVATDVVRGYGAILYPNLTLQEGGSADTFFTANSDGFDINTNNLNVDENNYVSYNFKAGGTAVSNTDGSITSQVSANQAAGFSIVTYTGTGSAMTVGHGLNSAPELVIFKGRNATNNWLVLTTAVDGSTDYLLLNTDNAKTDLASTWSPDSSVLNFPSSSGLINNSNGVQQMVAYCFHSINGYQKIGKYTGASGSTLAVTTGFQPRFVMVKNTTSASSNWMIYDSVRDSDGTMNKYLEANTGDLEASAATASLAVNSDGFTVGNTSSVHLNKANDVYIYLAIA